MAKLISKTYGDALFELAIEENKLDDIIEEINVVAQAFFENEELMKLLNHPKIIKEEKVKLIENIFKNRVSDDVVGFLNIIVTKDRYNNLFEIFEYFNHRVKEYKNIGVAFVTSAMELDEEQKEKIKSKLLASTKYIEIEMNYMVDISIIGGLIIRIEDRVVDSSIKTQLETMSKQLSKIQLS